MGKRERRKGADAEREFIRELSECLGSSVGRNLNQPRDGGPDVDLGSFAIEVKRQESLRLGRWWKQTIEQADEKTPVLAFRRSCEPWTVLVGMSIEGFSSFVKSAQSLEDNLDRVTVAK